MAAERERRDGKRRERRTFALRVASRPWLSYPLSIAFIVLLAVGFHRAGIERDADILDIPFLVAVAIVAFVSGRGPAIIAALVSSIAFNYFFVPPPNAFSVPKIEEVVLLAGLLAVAVALSTLTDRARTARHEADQLAASERLQKTLLSSISHDLRTPLTAIMGSLSTLLAEDERLAGSVRRELLTIAYDQTKALNWLVTQILEMTRLESGVVTFRREPAHLGNFVHGTIAQSGGAVNGRCRVEVPPGLPMVPMDSVLLSHALGNILNNAVKYSHPDTPIEINAHQQDGVVVLSVADRGIGIPAAGLTRVFEKFYRLPQPVPAAGGPAGIGLGLAIAKGIVEAHEGRIWAEQRAGGGTVISLTLPLHGR